MTFISSARLLLSLLVVFATLFETSRAFAPSRYASGSSQVLLGTNLRHFRFGSKLKSSTSRLYRRGSLVLLAIDVKEGNLVEFTSKNGEVILGIRRILERREFLALCRGINHHIFIISVIIHALTILIV